MKLLHCMIKVFFIAGITIFSLACARNLNHWQTGSLVLAFDNETPFYSLRFTYPRSPLFVSSVFHVFTGGVNYTFDPEHPNGTVMNNETEYGVTFDGSISELIKGNTSVITEDFKNRFDFKVISNSDLDSCEASCTTNPSCGAYEFYHSDSKCILVSGPVPPMFQGAFFNPFPEPDVTSYIKTPKVAKLIPGNVTTARRVTYYGFTDCNSVMFPFTLEDHPDMAVRYTIYQCPEFGDLGFIFDTTFSGDFDDSAIESCIFDNRKLDPPFCTSFFTNSPFPNFRLSFRDDTVKGTFWYGPYSSMKTSDFDEANWLTNSSCGPFMLHLDGALLLFAPLESPHDTFVRVEGHTDTDGSVQCGINGFISKVPDQAHFSFLLTSGSSFMEPLLIWGKVLQQYVQNVTNMSAVNQNVPRDLIQKIGYWTDRHSYYSESWFLEHVKDNATVLGTLSPVRDAYEMCQTDLTYFFISAIWAGKRTNLFKCIHNESVNQTFLGETDIGRFVKDLNRSVILQIPMLCGDYNHSSQVNVTYSVPFFMEDNSSSRVVLPQSTASFNFWDQVFFNKFFGQDSSYNGTHGTFLADVFRYTSLFPELFTQYNGVRYFFGNYTRAALHRSMITLLDNTSPLDLVEAIYHPTFMGVMSKASITRGMNPVNTEDFGIFSLTSALNVSVILSSILTGQKVTDVECRTVLTPMARSTGGFGDQLFRNDPSALKSICDKNNIVLWPTYGAMPFIDPFANLSSYNTSVVSATVVSDQYYYYQILFSESFPFFQPHMFPFPLSDDDGYVSLDIDNNLPYCCNGCDATLCVAFDPFNYAYANNSNGLFLFSPEITCGDLSMHLLGEIGKAVRVSATRFIAIECDETTVTVNITVHGAKTEVINVLLLLQQLQRGPIISQLEVSFKENYCNITCNGRCSVGDCFESL